jgi:hypothetical protein
MLVTSIPLTVKHNPCLAVRNNPRLPVTDNPFAGNMLLKISRVRTDGSELYIIGDDYISMGFKPHNWQKL